MEVAHPTHRYLRPPPWASQRPEPGVAAWGRLARPWLILPTLTEAWGAADPFVPAGATLAALRQEVAGRLGVPWTQVVLGPSATALFGLLCRAVLRPGDRVALAQPTRSMWAREVLALGASYVDLGRDHTFGVQAEPLARVLGDPPVIRFVALGAPDRPLGTVPSPAVLDAIGTAAVWRILDHSDAPPCRRAPGCPPRTVILDELAWAGAGPLGVAYLVTTPELAERIWSLAPASDLLGPAVAVARAALAQDAKCGELLDATRARARAVAEGLGADRGLEVLAAEGPCLFLRVPGTPAARLAPALSGQGLAVAERAHWSWREGVCLGLGTAPAQEIRGAILRALSALMVLAMLGAPLGCRGAPPPPPQSTPPAPEASAAPASAPAPVPADLRRTLREPLVGGCLRHCADGPAALQGFLRALVAEAPRESAARFLDAAELSLDGAAVGAELSELWRAGQLAARRARLDALIDELARELGGIARTSLERDIDALAVDSFPSRARASLPVGGATWQLGAHRRGREWLVHELVRAR